MPVTFTNPGEIDPRLISTLGVNVKESDSAIGFFGTGLKYAIAVLLREDQQLTIWSGTKKISFETRPATIRGKEFGFIYMLEDDAPPMQLGFTTELGKNWNLAHAYRELYCNAKDEGGEVASGPVVATTGRTTISVSGALFARTHAERAAFLLINLPEPLFENDEIVIYPGGSSSVFYRGIAAHTLRRMSGYTYNIKAHMDLTEDRTIKYEFFMENAIIRALTQGFDKPDRISPLLTTPTYERELNYESHDWSKDFTAAVADAVRRDPCAVPEGVANKLARSRQKLGDSYQIIRGDQGLEHELGQACEFLESIGFPVRKFKIVLVEDLGNGILGLAKRNNMTIYLARKTFAQAHVEETLLEEFIHLEYNVDDHSRRMQDVMLREIVRVGRSRSGRSMVMVSPIPDTPF